MIFHIKINAYKGLQIGRKRETEMRNKVMTMLNEHKDQLALAPELIIDELIKKYEYNGTLQSVEACHPEHLWDRYGLPYILPMTTKVFARENN